MFHLCFCFGDSWTLRFQISRCFDLEQFFLSVIAWRADEIPSEHAFICSFMSNLPSLNGDDGKELMALRHRSQYIFSFVCQRNKRVREILQAQKNISI